MPDEKGETADGKPVASRPTTAGSATGAPVRDVVLAADLSPRDREALVQTDAGIRAVQTFLARTEAVVERPTAQMAREVMVLLAAAGVSDSPADAAFVSQVHAAAFTLKMLYWMVVDRVTATLEGLRAASDDDARALVLQRLIDFLALLDPAFATLTVERVKVLMRSSSLKAKGAATHGPAYTAAAMALDVTAFGFAPKPGETKGKTLARVTDLLRKSSPRTRSRSRSR